MLHIRNLVKLLSNVPIGVQWACPICALRFGNTSSQPPHRTGMLVPPGAGSFWPRDLPVMSLLFFVLHNYDSVGSIIDGIAYKEYYRRVFVPFREWNRRKAPGYAVRRRKRVPAIQESPRVLTLQCSGILQKKHCKVGIEE